jgi:hypothetical protein
MQRAEAEPGEEITDVEVYSNMRLKRPDLA